LQIWANEGIENRINKVPVDVKITTDSGEQIQCNYKLPQVKITPDNICYGAKTVRDGLWLTMTRDEIKKTRIMLLLADKKMSEFDLLSKKGKDEMAVKSAKEAVNKLDEGYQILEKIDPKTEEIKNIKAKYVEAGAVYEQMIDENKKMTEIISIIKEWNELRKKEK